MSRRRFFRHGELPLVLLALTSEHPRHGYEIMSELTRLFGPKYRASPGSVYPAIEALQAEGLIDGQAEGGRTVYRITPIGTQSLEDRADMLAALELRLGVNLTGGDGLEAQLNNFKARLAPLNGRVDLDASNEVLELAASAIEALGRSKIKKQPQRSSNAR